MNISKEQYEEILKKQDKEEIIIYIDTSSFRQFFTKIDNKKTKELIEESLFLESATTKIIMFLLEPISLIIACISTTFIFKWWACLLIPVVVFLWVILKSRASIGKQEIYSSCILLIIGMILSYVYRAKGFWFQSLLISLPLTYFFSKLLYYLSALFAFRLIHRNYKFFDLFYQQHEGAITPMIWTEENKK